MKKYDTPYGVTRKYTTQCDGLNSNHHLLITGDSTKIVLPKRIVCVITSPPYFKLRNYGDYTQIGQEPSFDGYITNLVKVFDKVYDSMLDYGNLFINIGYYRDYGVMYDVAAILALALNKSKNLFVKREIGVLQRLLEKYPNDTYIQNELASLVNDNKIWYLKQLIIWEKENGLPDTTSSRSSRFNSVFEPVLHLVKSIDTSVYVSENNEEISLEKKEGFRGQTNYFNLDATRVSYSSEKNRRVYLDNKYAVMKSDANYTVESKKVEDIQYSEDGRPFIIYEHNTKGKIHPNIIKTHLTQKIKVQHLAPFPESLIEPLLLSGSLKNSWVLDPFAGSGTVAYVSALNGRNSISIEINNDAYIDFEQRFKGILK